MSVQSWPPRTCLFGDVWCFVGSKTVQNQKKCRKKCANIPQKYQIRIFELCLFQNCPIWPITIQFDATLVPMGSKKSDCNLTVLFHNVQLLMSTMFWHRPAERWRRSWGNMPNSLLPFYLYIYICIICWFLGWILEEKEVVHSILLRNVQFLLEAFQSYQQFRKPKSTEISALLGVQDGNFFTLKQKHAMGP